MRFLRLLRVLRLTYRADPEGTTSPGRGVLHHAARSIGGGSRASHPSGIGLSCATGDLRCPFHPDRHASLHVYETAERGWYCYGRCRRGGTIYDLAAPLYGYDARGEDFRRLRADLRRLFVLEGP